MTGTEHARMIAIAKANAITNCLYAFHKSMAYPKLRELIEDLDDAVDKMEGRDSKKPELGSSINLAVEEGESITIPSSGLTININVTGK